MIGTRQRWLKLTGWLIPLAYVVVTLVVGMVFPRLENRFLPERVSTISASSMTAIGSTIARSFADTEEKKDASVADRQGLGIGESEAAEP